MRTGRQCNGDVSISWRNKCLFKRHCTDGELITSGSIGGRKRRIPRVPQVSGGCSLFTRALHRARTDCGGSTRGGRTFQLLHCARRQLTVRRQTRVSIHLCSTSVKDIQDYLRPAFNNSGGSPRAESECSEEWEKSRVRLRADTFLLACLPLNSRLLRE